VSLNPIDVSFDALIHLDDRLWGYVKLYEAVVLNLTMLPQQLGQFGFDCGAMIAYLQKFLSHQTLLVISPVHDTIESVDILC
jgi:hypothetical protein